MTNIDKTLKIKSYTNSRKKLLKHYHQYLNVFDRKAADTISSLREKEIDHDIELEKNENEKTSSSFWDSLYNMSQEKLLILRKTLTELLNKRFIRISNSFAATSVLFVKKLSDELRFCVDYRDLNCLTRKNWYSLFLINETLERIDRVI